MAAALVLLMGAALSRAVSEFVVSVVSMRSVGAARGGGRRRWLVPLWGDDLDDAGSAVAGAAAADPEGEVVVPGKGDRGNLDARDRRSASPCRSFDGRRGKRRRAIGSGLQRCDIGERPVQASGKRHRLIGLSLGRLRRWRDDPVQGHNVARVAHGLDVGSNAAGVRVAHVTNKAWRGGRGRRASCAGDRQHRNQRETLPPGRPAGHCYTPTFERAATVSRLVLSRVSSSSRSYAAGVSRANRVAGRRGTSARVGSDRYEGQGRVQVMEIVGAAAGPTAWSICTGTSSTAGTGTSSAGTPSATTGECRGRRR